MSNTLVEMHFSTERDGIRTVTLYRYEEDGQCALIASDEFGPFCTALEVAQWAWRYITLALAPPAG